MSAYDDIRRSWPELGALITSTEPDEETDRVGTVQRLAADPVTAAAVIRGLAEHVSHLQSETGSNVAVRAPLEDPPALADDLTAYLTALVDAAALTGLDDVAAVFVLIDRLSRNPCDARRALYLLAQQVYREHGRAMPPASES